MNKPLLKPVNINGLVVKNRLGLGPINTGFLRIGLKCNPLVIEFYNQYITSGVGLIYFGGLAVSKQGKANASSTVLDTGCIADVETVVQLAHAAATRIVFQLEHAGRQANPDEIGADIVAPSAIACPVVQRLPRALDEREISDIIGQFVNASQIAASYGADLVEIHAAHGYLLSSFLSPRTNKRNDQYGGNRRNRFRLLFEVIDEISKVSSVPLGIRVNCTDDFADGISFGDVLWGLRELSQKISFVSLSGGMYSPYEDLIMPRKEKGIAIWRSFSRAARQSTGLPVFLGGNINTAYLANKLVDSGDADVILMARELLADPRVLSRLVEGEQEAPRCLYCGECKYHSLRKQWVDCPLNAVLVEMRRQASVFGIA